MYTNIDAVSGGDTREAEKLMDRGRQRERRTVPLPHQPHRPRFYFGLLSLVIQARCLSRIRTLIFLQTVGASTLLLMMPKAWGEWSPLSDSPPVCEGEANT